MKKYLPTFFAALAMVPAAAQVSVKKFVNNYSPQIGVCQGIAVREAGFSGLVYIPGTDLEFYTVSDRGFAIDADKTKCATGKEKVIPFPGYSPKIHHIKLSGDSIRIMETMTVKRPDGTDATGLPLPVGAGNTGEVLWGNVPAKTSEIQLLGTDNWGVDPEGICIGADNTFWICEEFGASIWHLDATGKVITRYSPFGDGGNQAAVDTVLRHRRPNKGFEGIAITPSGKVYGFLQSTMFFPSPGVIDSTRVMRILEIDPATNKTRTFAYINDGTITSGKDKVTPKDWKIGDAAAINDHEFLVVEHEVRKSINQQIIYRVDLAGATPITKEWINGKAIEEYKDEVGLLSAGITPVRKTKFIDLAETGWPASLTKPEDLAIVNDSTIVVGVDNDYGIESNHEAVASATGEVSVMYVFSLKGASKIAGYIAPVHTIIPAKNN